MHVQEKSDYINTKTEMLLSKLNQHSILSLSILNKILLSKRLLIDHIESLELCLVEIPAQSTESSISTFCKSAVFTCCTLLCKHFIPKEKVTMRLSLTAAFGTFSLVFIVKSLLKLRNYIAEKSLDNFIKALESFSNCIKRNVVYFNEIKMMRSQNRGDYQDIDYRQTEKVWNCIKEIKAVIEILYEGTRKLEKKYQLSLDIADLYCPMEELNDCDYFRNDVTSFTSKNIKDFYNIFAYVQSQYLFRLALIASQNFSMHFIRDDLSFLTKYIEKLIEEDEKYFKKLSSETRRLYPVNFSSLNRGIPYQENISGPAFVLRNSSLKLSSCIYAVAEECQKLDDVLQRVVENQEENEASHLLEIANSMRAIENSLSVCCDDFHRLILVYNKFLGDKLNPKTKEQLVVDDIEENELSNLVLNMEENNEQEKFDDFFAFLDDDNILEYEKEEEEGVNDSTSQLYDLDEKVTKKKFKPVLKQLRDKINPIRQEMLEKERKVLESKGIDVNKFLQDDRETSEDSDSSEGSFDELERKINKNKKKDSYAEMREFLAKKETVNLFNLQLPTGNTLNEDILE